MWKPFRCGDDVILSMIHLNCLPILAFLDDTSALTPHLGCAKGIGACHPCQALEAIVFPAFLPLLIMAGVIF